MNGQGCGTNRQIARCRFVQLLCLRHVHLFIGLEKEVVAGRTRGDLDGGLVAESRVDEMSEAANGVSWLVSA